MPDLVIIAGPNGSGKSTILPGLYNTEGIEGSLQPKNEAFVNNINPDDIAREQNISIVATGRIVNEKANTFLEKGLDFSFETTLSGVTYFDLIKKAQEKEYRIYIIFCIVDSYELSMVRVTQRATNGRHYIKLADIERRYSRSFKNFFNKFKDKSFFWLVVDNSGKEFQPICWGGNYSNSKTAYYFKESNLTKMREILKELNIEPNWDINTNSTNDTFSPFVFSKIQEVIKKEIKNRPKENYISISENGEVKFIQNT